MWSETTDDLREAEEEAANYMYNIDFGKGGTESKEEWDATTKIFMNGYLWCLRIHNIHVGSRDID